MANQVNDVRFVGNLGADPEMRYTPSGSPVTNFRLAVSEGQGDKRTTMWLRIVAWDKQAEICAEYLKKGSKVQVFGRLQLRTYTDKEGVEKQSVEVLVDSFGGVMFLDPPQGKGQAQHHDDDGYDAANVPF